MQIKSITNTSKQNFGVVMGPSVKGIVSSAYFAARQMGDKFTLNNIESLSKIRNDLRLTTALELDVAKKEYYVFKISQIDQHPEQSARILTTKFEEKPVCIINKLANVISKLAK